MIRDPVYMLLKYRGSFKLMINSPYFIEPKQRNEFFYKSSPKVPFYMVYECSPNIQEALMTKYLENPINPMMFISYNQNVPRLHSLETTDPSIERTCHMDIAYSKFKKTEPSLFCFGSPQARKSGMINDIFGLEFEVLQDGAAGLYHDSVDAIFTSTDVNLGFNVFDF